MKLPKGWKEITINQFNQLDLILKDKELDEIDREIEVLCALTGLAPDYFESLLLSDFKKCIENVSFLKSDPSKLITHRFKVGGNWFKLILEVNKLSAGQYIDLMTYVKDKEKINENAHKLMATICIPIKKTLLGFKELPYKGDVETQELFLNNLTMDIVFPATVFFCNYWEALTPIIKDSLEEAMGMLRTESQKSQTPILNSGVGL